MMFALAYSLLVIMQLIGVNEGMQASSEQVNQTITEIQNIPVSTFSIFMNNWMIALLSGIPFLGIVFFVFVYYNTGYVFGVIGQYQHLSYMQTLSLTFTNIVGIWEEIAICLVLTESLVILYTGMRDGLTEAKDRLMKYSWRSVLVATVILFFASMFETWLITGGIA